MINIVGKDTTSEIHIGNQMFRRTAQMCFEKFKMKKLHIITDENLDILVYAWHQAYIPNKYYDNETKYKYRS